MIISKIYGISTGVNETIRNRSKYPSIICKNKIFSVPRPKPRLSYISRHTNLRIITIWRCKGTIPRFIYNYSKIENLTMLDITIDYSDAGWFDRE